jgi:branched-chain amino acid transport system substrate-binding protein
MWGKRTALGLIGGLALMLTCGATAYSRDKSDQPIRIGFIGEESGPFSFFGTQTTRAIKLAGEQTNAQGGILGRKVEIVDRDSRTSVNDAVRQARDLLFSEHVDFLMHSINSAECVAIANIARQARTIMFSACANDNFLTKDNPYTFRVPNIVTHTQGYAVADFVLDTLKPKGKRYYTFANDYAYGRLVVAAFKTRILERQPNAQFVGEGWPKATENDLTPYITAILSAKPDIVFTALGVGVPFWQQSAPFDLSHKVQIVSPVWGGSDELQALSESMVPTSAILGGFPWYGIKGPVNDSFVDRSHQAYGKPPAAAAYLEYISFQALKAGIEKAKTTETQAVIKALEGLTFDSVLGNITIRAFDHQGTTPLWLGTATWDQSLKLGVIADIHKLPTDRYLPTKAEFEKLRRQ